MNLGGGEKHFGYFFWRILSDSAVYIHTFYSSHLFASVVFLVQDKLIVNYHLDLLRVHQYLNSTHRYFSYYIRKYIGENRGGWGKWPAENPLNLKYNAEHEIIQWCWFLTLLMLIVFHYLICKWMKSVVNLPWAHLWGRWTIKSK